MMGNKYFQYDTDDDDFFCLDDIGDESEQEDYKQVVRKCMCGYRGALVPDVRGLRCENCDHLLVEWE